MKAFVQQEMAKLKIGTTIATLRERSHLTQTELAARAGMSASKVSMIESGPKNIELSTLIRLATALGYRFRTGFVRAKGRMHAMAFGTPRSLAKRSQRKH
jgi:transcriptional regulator with XRE-family HTH domain